MTAVVEPPPQLSLHLPGETTPLFPSQPSALIFIPISLNRPPCGFEGEHLLLPEPLCQAVSSMRRQAGTCTATRHPVTLWVTAVARAGQCPAPWQVTPSVLAVLMRLPSLLCLRASPSCTEPLQRVINFAEGAMPGAHSDSHCDRAGLAQKHGENKTSAARRKANGGAESTRRYLQEGEIPREMETSRFFCAPGLAAWQSPYGLRGAAPAGSFSSRGAAGGGEQWGGRGMFSSVTRGVHGAAGPRRAGTFSPCP